MPHSVLSTGLPILAKLRGDLEFARVFGIAGEIIAGLDFHGRIIAPACRVSDFIRSLDASAWSAPDPWSRPTSSRLIEHLCPISCSISPTSCRVFAFALRAERDLHEFLSERLTRGAIGLLDALLPTRRLLFYAAQCMPDKLETRIAERRRHKRARFVERVPFEIRFQIRQAGRIEHRIQRLHKIGIIYICGLYLRHSRMSLKKVFHAKSGLSAASCSTGIL